MNPPKSKKAFADRDSLKAELIACDFWDSGFYRSARRDPSICIAFVNRQNRRRELALEIVALSDPEDEGGATQSHY